jgi:hypothetical protein
MSRISFDVVKLKSRAIFVHLDEQHLLLYFGFFANDIEAELTVHCCEIFKCLLH